MLKKIVSGGQTGADHLPEVLAIRLEIYRRLAHWELMHTVAKKLLADDPVNVQWIVSVAYATRRADSIGAARAILLEAVERMPDIAILHYNLACYECRLGDLEVAKARLQHAFKLSPKMRLEALADEDLGRCGTRYEDEHRVTVSVR